MSTTKTTSSSTTTQQIETSSSTQQKVAIGDVTNSPLYANKTGCKFWRNAVCKQLFANDSSANTVTQATAPTRRSSSTRTRARPASASTCQRHASTSSHARTQNGASPQNGTASSSHNVDSSPSHKASTTEAGETQSESRQLTDDAATRLDYGAVVEARYAQLNVNWQRAIDAEKSKLDAFVDVLKTIAHAYSALNAFRCSDALANLADLPQAERASPFALKHVALAHFEARDLARACDAFERLRREYPFSASGLDVYSTALWYVQKSASLSALAHELVASHAHAPQTWIAVANSFSLQRDVERTIMLLERSLKLKERAYAHALLGHELLNGNETARARAAFARAVEVDARCYLALFGLGMLHLRANELAHAELCMRRAARITPRISVVVCHLGIVRHAQRRYDDALQLVGSALELHPRDTTSRFHFASILFSIARYDVSFSSYNFAVLFVYIVYKLNLYQCSFPYCRTRASSWRR